MCVTFPVLCFPSILGSLFVHHLDGSQASLVVCLPSDPEGPLFCVLQPVHLGNWGDDLLLPAQSLGFQGSSLTKVEVASRAVVQGLRTPLSLVIHFSSWALLRRGQGIQTELPTPSVKGPPSPSEQCLGEAAIFAGHLVAPWMKKDWSLA